MHDDTPKPSSRSDDAKERRRRSREINRQLHPWTTRRLLAWSLFVTACLIAVNHIFAHLGARLVPMGMGRQDLFIGWPAAGLIGLVGLMIIDPRETRPTAARSKRRP